MKPHPDFEALDMPTALTVGSYHLSMLTGANVEEDFEVVLLFRTVLRLG
ncbi:hypothetical protein [Sulfitobacter sp.]